ncbi:hypothetical protein DL89DRAFT_267187 [Linderina pennispora]|uniref:PH domain-containing protein n=1 Tax=Linderina pennispora TaxID=61395 RepID=A0A1Y1W969_9FUNG|nr:uncharacterized protein DL89DRAFT_267187 [Linderina pennispora]ORX69945.1 hypothetical protein DL89DRAFT_267187 [Linderina pennispora]
MPILPTHNPFSSLLGGQKVDNRTAFSPYTGSLSKSSPVRAPEAPEAPPMGMGATTSITLHVRYVAKDMWRKVTFPPGITVTQARDICMLRFNIWQQTMLANEATGELIGGSDQRASVDDKGKAGSAMGFGQPQSQTQFREQYGLFWTSAGHWLEAMEMLNTYPLRKGEVLELQHVVDFIPLQPHEFKFSYVEGYIHYLQSDGVASTWQLKWAVFRNRILRLYRKKGQAEADVTMDLSHGFRLSDQDGHSWPKSKDTPSMATLVDTLSQINIAGDGGVLVVQLTVASSQVNTKQTHSFRTCTAFDYDMWRKSLRHTISGGAGGGGAGGMGIGCSTSGSASISATSNNSHVPVSMSSDSSNPPGPTLHNNVMSPQSQRPPTDRHEGYVNRKAPDGYGFRRRYCVVLPTALYGFLQADASDGIPDEKLIDVCEFAISLDPASVTVEAISWNGRYLLRVFGPDSQALRDLPHATSMPGADDSRIQCTDILATAAQKAIEQYGSTFGLLPDSRELVRLMIDDHDEGHRWAVAFNSIAGVQITGQSRIIIGARRTHSLTESRSHVNMRPAEPPAPRRNTALTIDECASIASTPSVGKQQSLSEFMVSQVDGGEPKSAEPPVPAKPLKWVPLSIDKYVKEDEEQRRRQVSSGYESTLDLQHNASLKTKKSNVSGDEHNSAASSSSARPPARFNWFKRRGSTSR